MFPVEADRKNNPLVSVIIVTYNRKQEVVECVDSALNSSYGPLEVVVVDNASSDGTQEELERKYRGKIKLVKSEKNIYAGGGRNLGAKFASGDYLLFIDSDNIVAADMIENMIKGVTANKDVSIGLSGPFTYYKSSPQRLCWVNNRISLLTSLTFFKGNGEEDSGQYEKLNFIKVGHIPNAFMIHKDIFKIIGGIDRDYVMHYEESDLSEKARRLGFNVVLFPKAKVWHNLPSKSERGHKSFKGRNPGMVYYVLKNRIIFMRKNSGGTRLFLFITIFSSIFLVYNLAILLFYRKYALLKLALKGHWDGLFMPLTKS